MTGREPRVPTMPRMVLLGLVATLGVAAVATAQDVGPPERAAGDPVRSDSARPPADPLPAATQPAGDARVPDDPWSSPEIAAPRMDARPLPRKREPAGRAANEGGHATSQSSWGRTTLSLLGVVTLIVLLAWGYKVVAGHGGGLRLTPKIRQRGLIEVVSRTALSPRQSLYLVRIGPRLVLIGCTHESIRALDVIHDADLTARLLGEAAQQRPDSHTAEFARCLEQAAAAPARVAEPAVATAPPGAGAPPDGAQLAKVKEHLAATLQRLREAGTCER